MLVARNHSYAGTRTSISPGQVLVCVRSSGAKGNRTLDLFHAMEALYQLSYSPIN